MLKVGQGTWGFSFTTIRPSQSVIKPGDTKRGVSKFISLDLHHRVSSRYTYKPEASSLRGERDKNLDPRDGEERRGGRGWDETARIASPEMRVSRIVLRAASSARIWPRVYRPLY